MQQETEKTPAEAGGPPQEKETEETNMTNSERTGRNTEGTMRAGTRSWCWWLHRYIWYKRSENGAFVFEDCIGAKFILTKNDLQALRERPEA